jgi:hypothetical protein
LYWPEYGRSVPSRRVTVKVSALSSLRHSSSVLTMVATLALPRLTPALEKFSMVTSAGSAFLAGPDESAASAQEATSGTAGVASTPNKNPRRVCCMTRPQPNVNE